MSSKLVVLLWRHSIFFEFSKRPPPSWIFEIANFYWLLERRGSRQISKPNFVKIGQSVAKILRFFSIFQDGGCHHLGLSIHKILLADSSGGLRCITLPNFVKIGRSTAEMLQLFEFSRWPQQPFWIFKIAKFYCLLGSRRISMPNFSKIGQSVVKILTFFGFSRWWRPPSWIVKFTKFYWLTVSGWPRHIIVPNLIKICGAFPEILQFCENGGRCRLVFLKS